jgi:hypothetical protein
MPTTTPAQALAHSIVRLHQPDTNTTPEGRELELYLTNTEPFYRQAQAICDNLARKIVRAIPTVGRRLGTAYNPDLAEKLWIYLVNEAAREYCREHGGSSRTMFPGPIRADVARALVYYYEDELAAALTLRL